MDGHETETKNNVIISHCIVYIERESEHMAAWHGMEIDKQSHEQLRKVKRNLE
jgi:hypothetical protein